MIIKIKIIIVVVAVAVAVAVAMGARRGGARGGTCPPWKFKNMGAPPRIT